MSPINDSEKKNLFSETEKAKRKILKPEYVYRTLAKHWILLINNDFYVIYEKFWSVNKPCFSLKYCTTYTSYKQLKVYVYILQVLYLSIIVCGIFKLRHKMRQILMMCKLTTSLPKHFPTDEEKYFAYFAAKNEPVLCKAAASMKKLFWVAAFRLFLLHVFRL